MHKIRDEILVDILFFGGGGESNIKDTGNIAYVYMV